MTQTLILSSETKRWQAKRLIELAPDFAVVRISAPNRTTDQNSKLWAMLSDVSRAKPEGRDYPPEIWKSIFMDSAGHQVRWEPSLDGNGVVNVGYRSSRLSVAEMSELIECVTAYAAEHGIELGDERKAA